MNKIVTGLLIALSATSFVHGQTSTPSTFTVEDRMLLVRMEEQIIKIQEEQVRLRMDTKQQIEQLERNHSDDMNQLDKRIERSDLWMLAFFTAIMTGVFGIFYQMYQERKTLARPIDEKYEALERRFRELEAKFSVQTSVGKAQG